MHRTPPSTLADLHDSIGLQGQRQRLPTQFQPRLAPTVVVRALYREWLRTKARWAPLVIVRRDLLGPIGHSPRWADALAQAAGGWLFVDGSLTEAEAARLTAGCDRLLDLDPDALPLDIDYDLRNALDRTDPWHAALTDPTLAEPRRLLAGLEAPTFVTVSGPPGAGRDGLVQSAALRATGRLALAPPGSLGHSGWLHIPSVEDLDHDPEIRAGLHDQLRLAAEAQAQPSPVIAEAPPRPTHPAFDPVVGESRALRRALHQAARIADQPDCVLLLGNTGTGKGAFARAIHAASGRRGPFVAVDIGGRGTDLIDAEIFGAEKGSHSTAIKDTPGWFEQAHKGTLFIDEIANIPLSLQQRLLQPLQDRTVTRLGALKERPVDVRVIAATNVSLREMSERGTFRRDLYNRIAQSIIYLPALADRRSDILRLATHLLGLPPGTQWCDEEAQERLEAWHWPGNIRELEATVKQARRNADGGLVRAGHLEFDDPRRTVVLVATDDTTAWPASLRAEDIRRCRSTTFTVPPLAARGPLAVRNAVLAGLGGLPISEGALSHIERARWSSLGDLQSLLARLRERGLPVERDTLSDLALDHSPSGRVPILIRMHPLIEEDHQQGQIVRRVASFLREVDADVVVLGRANRLREVEQQYDNPKHPEAGQQLRALLAGRPAALITLPGHEQMSRAQVIVQRVPQGLTLIRSLRANPVRVMAGPLDGLGLRTLAPGEEVELGEAGELCLYDRDRAHPRLLARIFLCLGAAVDEARQPMMLEALTAASAAAGLTEGLESADRVWAIDAAEVDGLFRLYCGVGEGRSTQSSAIRAWIRSAADTPALSRLCAYIQRSHPTQQVKRLVQHPPNEALRERLNAWVSAHPDPAALEEALGTMLYSALSPKKK